MVKFLNNFNKSLKISAKRGKNACGHLRGQDQHKTIMKRMKRNS